MFKNEVVSFVMGMGAAAGTTITAMLAQSVGQAQMAGDSTLAVAFVGASISTLVASTVAALLAMGISKPIQPRHTMWLYFVLSAMLGAAVAVIATTAPFMKSYFGGVHPTPIAFIASLPMRWIIPVIVDELPQRVRMIIRGQQDKDGEA